MKAPLHIVLYQPEIPPNTGNIARLCACTGCSLHLVHPLGFEVSDKYLKRAGLDYWSYLNVYHHETWNALRDALQTTGRWFALSTKATQTIWQTDFAPDDVLVFGPETRGLPEQIRTDMQALKIPIRDDVPVRSLNLASACAVTVYEALRQIKLHP
ncbi:MAG: tRNA (cytidine(34)-2'-O)-methyltransferase [Mariprofundaceae bacterium]